MIKLYLRQILTMALLLGAVTAQAAPNSRWATTITQSPVSVKAGQFVTFTAEFQIQQGPVAKLNIIGGVGNNRLYSKTFQNLGKNHRQRVSFRWKATEGTHRVFFYIDPQKRSPDSNRQDNRIQSTVNISPMAKAARPTTATSASMSTARIGAAPGSALPNIIVEQAYIELAGNPAKKDFYPGDRLRLGVKLKNSGQKATGPFWTKVLEIRQEMTPYSGIKKTPRELKKSSPSLAPGKSTLLTFDIIAEHGAIAYEWQIFPDYNNRVQEFEESTSADRLVTTDIQPSR